MLVDSHSERGTQSSSCKDQPHSLVEQSALVHARPRLPDSYVPPIKIVKVALRKKGKKGLEILQQHF